MSDEIYCLKVLVVSDAAPDRERLRHAASQCSTPIEIAEIGRERDASSACRSLQRDAFDVVFLDSDFPALKAVFDSARSAKSNPLAVLVGPEDTSARETLVDALAVDGALAKPIDAQDAKAVFECCVRARLQCRALIVDDSSTARNVIRKVVQASRYRLAVEEACDGAAAIEMALRQQFDIIFLDCNMPGVDGFTALEIIRHGSPNAKVVMITGMRDGRVEDRARESGAADFLYKPFFAKDIDVVLNRLFGLMRSRWG